MWTIDFYLGAVWTLLTILLGVLLTLLVIAVWQEHRGPDEPPGPPGPPDPNDDDPIGIAPDDFDLEAWLERNTIVVLPEANLMEDA